MRTTILLAAMITGLGLASSAQAQEADSGPAGVLRLGKIYSFGGGTDLQHGFGADLRYHVYPDRDVDGYVGLFGQGQYELGDAWRMAGGVSFGWDFIGLELGVSHRTETSTMAGSTGLHIGQSFTYGPISVGARVSVPIVDHVEQGIAMGVQGIEGALTLRLAFGFTVHGQRQRSGCHGGGHGHNPHAQGHGR